MSSDDLAYFLKNLINQSYDETTEQELFSKAISYKITLRLLKNLESLYEMKTDPESIKLEEENLLNQSKQQQQTKKCKLNWKILNNEHSSSTRQNIIDYMNEKAILNQKKQKIKNSKFRISQMDSINSAKYDPTFRHSEQPGFFGRVQNSIREFFKVNSKENSNILSKRVSYSNRSETQTPCNQQLQNQSLYELMSPTNQIPMKYLNKEQENQQKDIKYESSNSCIKSEMTLKSMHNLDCIRLKQSQMQSDNKSFTQALDSLEDQNKQKVDWTLVNHWQNQFEELVQQDNDESIVQQFNKPKQMNQANSKSKILQIGTEKNNNYFGKQHYLQNNKIELEESPYRKFRSYSHQSYIFKGKVVEQKENQNLTRIEENSKQNQRILVVQQQSIEEEGLSSTNRMSLPVHYANSKNQKNYIQLGKQSDNNQINQ